MCDKCVVQYIGNMYNTVWKDIACSISCLTMTAGHCTLQHCRICSHIIYILGSYSRKIRWKKFVPPVTEHFI